MSGEPKGVEAIAKTLPGISKEDYGAAHQEHSLEIYKLYLEMADRISSRREKANAFFLTVNGGILALLGKSVLGQDISGGLKAIMVPVGGMALCYLWYRLLRSYKDLNSAKFKVVHAIERRLPLRPYDAEWEAVGRGKDAKLYLPFTQVELKTPLVFGLFHAGALFTLIPWSSLFCWLCRC